MPAARIASALTLLFCRAAAAAGLTVTAMPDIVPPRGGSTVTATSTTDGAITFSLMTNNSGGSISSSTGRYTAGATPNVVDTVLATDPVGVTGTVAIMVGAGCSIMPATPALAPRAAQQLTALGGSGLGYAWSLDANNSGGSLNPLTGAYRAGPTGGVTDTVRVTDSLGNTATTTVTVGAGVSIAPPSATLAPRGAQTFAASGGSGTGYTWSFVTDNSGGTVGTTTGAYQAGPAGAVTDTVRVVDTLGNTATIAITVTAALAIMPATPGAVPKGQVSFSASGGSGSGLMWSMPGNASGGSVSAAGVYTAGTTASVTDVVLVTDSLGSTAQTTVQLGPAIAIAPIAPTVTPRGTKTFSAAGGSNMGYAFTLAPNSSGGSLNAGTGAYTAGATGGVVDVVRVTDSFGNVGTTAVTVAPGVSLSPASAVTPPNSSINFSAAGGSGMGFAFALAVNASGGIVNAVTGQYTSGATPGSDTVRVTDSLGNLADAVISVSGGLGATPPSVALPPRAMQRFSASGGSGTGYVWQLSVNNSGATFDPATGAYTAGKTGGVMDVVSLHDSLGTGTSATINVLPGVSVSPAGLSVPPRAQRTFTTGGGSGAGYTFSLMTNGSGGTVNATTGEYAAGMMGATTDVVAVTDSLGNVGTASITVTPGVAMMPAMTTVAPRSTLGFTASGGAVNSWAWSLMTNASGGSINAAGVYRAGATGGVMDVVLVRDAFGNSATGTVNVSFGVGVSPQALSLAPRATQAFTATGGTGAGYAWSFVSNASGGTLGTASGVYQAGSTPGATDLLQVVDSVGNVGLAAVMVTGGLSITPAMASVAPRQSLAFAADGGSGNAFQWSLKQNASGGSIDAGFYTAGATGAVMDLVQLVDGNSNVTGAPVTVSEGVSIAPTAVPLPPKGTLQFTASGGTGSGFVFSFVTNASGGTLDGASGSYQAGPHGRVSDVVQVADPLGSSATATVAIGDELGISPASVTLKARERQGFSATGGSGTGFVWSLASHPSGGSIAADTGLYTAGDVANVTDVVQVTDSVGNVQTAMVAVLPAGKVAPEKQDPLNGFACGCESGVATPLLLSLLLFRRRSKDPRARARARAPERER